MLGLPTETPEEMKQTIAFAAQSDLELAYFFKATCFREIVDIYKSSSNPIDNKEQEKSLSLCYFSRIRSSRDLSYPELNNIILEAQQKFYLNFRRLQRGFIKSPHKIAFLKKLFNLAAIILQAYLVRQLSKRNVDKKCLSSEQ